MRRSALWSILTTTLVGGAIAAVACGGETSPGDETFNSASNGASNGASTQGPNDLHLDGGLSPSFVYRDVNHVLGTGQSLALGSSGSPQLSNSQPYANTMFITGAVTGGTGLTAFAPLEERGVESMSSSLANLVTKLARSAVLIGEPPSTSSHDLLVSVHALDGRAYWELKKGGPSGAYENGIAQVIAANRLTAAANKSYIVRVVTTVHGESDQLSNFQKYEAAMLEWQADYENDVKAITGQAESIPMLETQISSWTKLTFPTSVVAIAQLSAHINAPGKVILVGPKYHLPYGTDGLHLTNEGYRHMGEDYAKVYRRVILEGKPWEPIHTCLRRRWSSTRRS